MKAADPMLPGPPPRACFGLEGEEEVPHLFNCGRIALGRATREATEECEHLLLHGRVEEERVTSFEISLLGLVGELAVLDCAPPLAAPRARDVDTVGHVHPFRLILVDGGAPEDEGERK